MCSACCQSLSQLGWSATIVLPRYRGIGSRLVERFQSASAHSHAVGFYDALADSAAVFVDCRNCSIAKACGVGSADFGQPATPALLVRTAEFWARQESRPSVVHAHDWQAGLAPLR
jgi:glycogen synthase